MAEFACPDTLVPVEAATDLLLLIIFSVPLVGVGYHGGGSKRAAGPETKGIEVLGDQAVEVQDCGVSAVIEAGSLLSYGFVKLNDTSLLRSSRHRELSHDELLIVHKCPVSHTLDLLGKVSHAAITSNSDADVADGLDEAGLRCQRESTSADLVQVDVFAGYDIEPQAVRERQAVGVPEE
ncbi:hypothetical protein M422DRAFT_258124 [Sphaerobolus stellatus SS14]|uniref:Uncharacterized protein n=1 Tax=Sphaerobolus stellatus (strain SS14) TaxID=990650 RepID=A0A0C9VN98_SPHS4|nr:hypothetical protein M422DRAFT_258124 [Sphaerobolus stellatus SS14]